MMRKLAIAAILVAGVVLAAAWWQRQHQGSSCEGPPLTRAQASAKARAQLPKFSSSLGVPGRFTEAGARFDSDSRSWFVTFKGPGCTVVIVVDRCGGKGAGGMTSCPSAGAERIAHANSR